jgi:UDP-N-acetylmuramyl pentapeptide phosphotransferase/UDP-N-acetylglucosamine-1-phosphate transferase
MLAAAFSLVVAVTGWYYLFNSRAVDNLRTVEQETANHRRAGLRRAGGLAMLLLAVCFYALFQSLDDANPRLFLAMSAAVVALLGFIIVLVLLDVRLTWQLERRRREREEG